MAHFRMPVPNKGFSAGSTIQNSKAADNTPEPQYHNVQTTEKSRSAPESHASDTIIPENEQGCDPTANGSSVSEAHSQKNSSFQIVHRFANKKVVDFSSRLERPHEKDFATVHGGEAGGYPSNIACTICDYSKGAGTNSVSVTYTIPAIHIEALYQAATAAQLHLLHQPFSIPDSEEEADAMFDVAGKVLSYLRQCLKTRSIPSWDDLVSLGKALGNAIQRYGEKRKAQEDYKKAVPPSYQYKREKNNPYDTFQGPDGRPWVHVMAIDITYVPAPARRLQWCIRISNFDAPRKMNGNQVSHISSKAEKRRECSIFLSEEKFWEIMRLVHSHIQLWEMGEVQQFEQKYTERDNFKKENANDHTNR